MGDREPAEMMPEVRKALDAITVAYRRAKKRVNGVTDGQAAFDQSTHIAARLRELADDASAFRASVVHRIWVAEELSLAALAAKLGISKSRADQLKRVAEKPTTPEEGTP